MNSVKTDLNTVLLLTGLCVCGSISAEPEVLAVLGPTVEIPFVADYLDALEASSQLLDIVTPPASLSTLSFPVVSKEMRPGRIDNDQAIKIGSVVTSTLAIVGQDSLSRDWLDANIAFLESSGIPIVVVNVDSQATFERIKSRYPGLDITALELDALARALQITLYPAIISSEGIFQ